MGKCRVFNPTVMKFSTFSGEVCYIKLSLNTKFEFNNLGNGRIYLDKKGFSIEISEEDFNKTFKIII